MSKNIFIPDDDGIFSVEGCYKGSIHYMLNTQDYQTVTWTAKQNIIYKLVNTFENSKDWNLEKKLLPEEEKIEYKKLFGKILEKPFTPKESTIKKCLIVIIGRIKGCEITIGLTAVKGDNYVSFKAGNVDNIKTICKKNNVTLSYDSYFAFYLLNNAYLNEVIPEEIFDYTARKYLKIAKRDKIFKEKLKQAFSAFK
jgi:type III secretion system FlhB-like substrate exporter